MCVAQTAPAAGGATKSAAVPIAMLTAADRSRTLFAAPSVALPKHTEEVFRAAYSPDGRWIAAVDVGMHLKISDPKTGELKHDVVIGTKRRDHFDDRNLGLSFRPDGTLLAVTRLDRSPEAKDEVRLLDPVTGIFVRTLSAEKLHNFREPKFSRTGDRLVVLADRDDGERCAIVWTLADGRLQIIATGGYPETYDLSPHDDTLALVGENNSIGLYELATGKLKHTFVGPTSSRATVQRLRFHPDGSTLLAHYQEIGLVAYDLDKKTRRFQVKDWHSGRMTFAPNGLLAVGGYRVALYVMGEKGFHQVGDCRGDDTNGDDLSFSPDGMQLLVAGVEQSVLPHLLKLEWSLEKRKIPTEVEFIQAVAASRDGEWLAWLGRDSLFLYSLKEGGVKASVKLSPPGERTLEFSPDGKHLLAAMIGYEGRRVQEFAVPSLQSTRDKNFEQSYLRGARYAPGASDLLIFEREKLHVWKAGTPAATESKLDFPPDKFEFVGGNQPRLFGIDDDTVYVYEGMNVTQPKTWPVGRPLDGFAVSPDGTSVATFRSGGKRVAVWDVKTAQLQFEFEADSKGLESVTFSGDGRWLLTAGEERGVRIWSSATGKLRASFTAHDGKTEGIVVVPGSSLFYTSPSGLFDDKAIKQWDLTLLLERIAEPAPPPPPPFTAGFPQYDLPSSNIAALGFVEAGKVVYALDYMNIVRGYDATTKQELWQVKVGETNTVEVSADGRWLASAHGNEREFEMKLYEQQRRSGNRTRNEKTELKPEPGHVKLWDVRTGMLHKTLPLETSTPLGLAFSPDGKTLAVASGTRGEMQFVIMGRGGEEPEQEKPVEQKTGPSPNSEISLWNVVEVTRTDRLPVGRGQFTRVRFSGDGGLLAFSGSDDHVTVWNLRLNAVQFRKKLDLPFTDLQFSTDSEQLAICSANRKRGRVEIIDTATGMRQPKFDDFDARVETIAFSPQGDLFITAARMGDKDFEYRFWNLADGREKRVLRLPEAGYGSGTANVVRFAPDGAKFVENGHGQVRVWRLGHLFDEPLQRSLQTLKDRGLELSNEGDVIRVKFPSGSATDRELKSFPPLSQPFELDLASSEHVTDIGLVSLITRKNLVGLTMNSCQNISLAGLAGLKRLPLRNLDVRSTKLTTPEAYEMIGGFRALENLKLDVGYTDNADILYPLSNLKNLRTLTFASANCAGTALFPLSKLVKLEELRFEGAKIEDDNLRYFARMPKLRVLEIRSYEDNFTGAGLAHLAGCRELQVLKLGGSALNDAGFSSLPSLKSLRTLDLSGTTLKGEGFKAIAGFTEIETLLLPGEITDAGLVHLAKLSRLRELDLSRRPITDRGLAALTGLQALEKLELSSNEGVTGSGLAALAGSAKLTSLDLSYCTGLTDEGLAGVAKLTQLTRLSLPPQISDAGMKHLNSLTSLWDLTIRKAKITDAGIAAIPNLQNLKSLDLDGAILTEAAIPRLHALEKLSSVNIGKSAFTKEAKERLAKRSKESTIYVRTGE